MKYSLTIILVALFGLINSINLKAQIGTEGFHFQAVARDVSGEILTETPLIIRITIFSGGDSPLPVYEENHNISTDLYGLINLNVGEGLASFGVFTDIDWAESQHSYRLEMDRGSGFIDLGTYSLRSVPYANVAQKVIELPDMELEDIVNVEVDDLISGNILKWDGAKWTSGADSIGLGSWSISGSKLCYDTGFVGIGICTPLNLLHLNSDTGNLGLRMSSPTSQFIIGIDETEQVLGIGDTNIFDSGAFLNITQSGLIGIGTGTPLDLLHVHAGSGSTNMRYSNPLQEFIIGIDETEQVFRITGDVASGPGTGGNALSITGDGKVGIGTDNPESVLHIESNSGDAQLKFSSPSQRFIAGIDEISGKFIIARDTGISEFKEILIIDSTGKAGIGKIDSIASFFIEGRLKTQEIQITGPEGEGFVLSSDTSGNPVLGSIDGGLFPSAGIIDLYDTSRITVDQFGAVDIFWEFQRYTPGSEFNHVLGSTDITIQKEGTYEIFYDISFQAINDASIELKIMVDDGSGFKAVPGSYTYIGVEDNSARPYNAASHSISLKLSVGDLIKLQTTCINGSSTWEAQTMPNASSFRMRYLGM